MAEKKMKTCTKRVQSELNVSDMIDRKINNFESVANNSEQQLSNQIHDVFEVRFHGGQRGVQSALSST